MTAPVGSFKEVPRFYPWKATIAVALGALSAACAVLGAVHVPLGKLDFMAKLLQSKQCFIPLAVTGGVFITVGLTSIGIGRSGSGAFKQPSLYRLIRNVVRLPINAIRTSWVKNQKVHDGKVLVQKLGTNEQLELDPAENKYKRWNRRGKLNGADVECFAHALLANSPKVQYVKVRVSMNETNQDMGLPKKDAHIQHIYIDLELAGSIDHIVTLHIDSENHTVEYYDSKGLTINDRFGVRVLGTGGKSLPQFIQELVTTYGDGNIYEVIENTHVHQFDLHSCGVWVSYRKCGWKFQTQLDAMKTDSRKELESRRIFMELIRNDISGFVFQEDLEPHDYKDRDGEDFEIDEDDK